MKSGLTRQSLPDRDYLELLGAALCVYNSNFGFLIENIRHTDPTREWRDLVDKPAGGLLTIVKEVISKRSGNNEIADLFKNLSERRHRIIHSLRATSRVNKQTLYTKEMEKNGGEQFEITVRYLEDFVSDNSVLAGLLDEYRNSTKK